MRLSIKTGFAALVALCLASTAALAGTYKSFEGPKEAIAKNRLQYGVIVTTLAKVTDPRIVGEHDGAERVRVQILARDPRRGGSFKTARNPFETISFQDDVMYSINAYRKHGLSLMIYLDEMDQTSVKLKGIRGSISMETESNER
jgi:hypothetical protein